MVIKDDVLEKACKDMIETILLILDHAFKGTIYRVGPMPELQVTRISSGLRIEGTDRIGWGTTSSSDYCPPGKGWEEYRDYPGHVLEAIAWCVEKQKSWTADDPREDTRSVRKQVYGELEDFHHMEPVLVRKVDLYPDHLNELPYPLDWQEKPIWKECEYVVVAVVKIHFRPSSIRRGDPATKIIKRLSQSLGTQLLSHHIKQTWAEAQKEFTRQRLEACNVLAHELRNTLTKLGFVFSAINAEISFIREQWESILEQALPSMGSKTAILERLNELLSTRLSSLNGADELVRLARNLTEEQAKLMNLPLDPQMRVRWILERVRPKWRRLITESLAWNDVKDEIDQMLSRLQEIIRIGTDESSLKYINNLPEDLKTKWYRLAYRNITPDQLSMLDDILHFLEHPQLDIPHKRQSKKVITSLKALAEVIPQLELKTNNIIHCLRNGIPLAVS